MKIKKYEIFPGLIHLKFNSQYDLTSTFMRLQEYYESPIEKIRGHYFTLETFMDEYAKFKGNFTYCTDWSGFNIPDFWIRSFFLVEDFKNDLLWKEMELSCVLKKQLLNKKTFYVIGTYNDDSVEHEIAHGLFYLDKSYKEEVLKIIKTIPKPIIKKIETKLSEMGYCKNVFYDELNAYFVTSSNSYLKKHFKTNLTKQRKSLIDIFKKYKGIKNGKK